MARKGSSGGSSGNSNIVILPSGGSGSAITQDAYINNQHYLKPTQIGFDSFVSIGRYPISDISGTSEVYSIISYLEIRYTDTYTDASNFWDVWDTASSIHVTGSTSNYTTNYSHSVGVGNYLHHTPVLSDGYEYQQLVVVRFLNQSMSHMLTWGSHSLQLELNVLSEPSVSFSQTTNNFTITGGNINTLKIIEFNRPSYSPFSSYATQEEIDIFYNCSARNQEWGLYYGQAQQFENFNIWESGNYTVKLEFNSSHPTETRTRFSNAVNNWISITNDVLAGSNVTFTRNDLTSNPSILIQTKNNYDMGGSGYYVYAGHWLTTKGESGYIETASIELNYETQYYDYLFTTVEAIVTEELYEALGCGGDLTTRADCINSDFNWYGKNNGNYSQTEEHILQLMYLSNLKNYVGADSQQLAVICNPSNGFFSTSINTASAVWMTENIAYNLRIWQVDSSNGYSVVPSYSQTFTVINMSNVYYWNGSSWVQGEVYTWNGSSWVKATQVYSWNGSSWS